jgi:hypothetical protein
MKIEVPLYFNWASRGVLAAFPDVEWRRIPPGYYHNIQVQHGRIPGANSTVMVMFWFNMPAKVYNVDGPSPPLPVFEMDFNINSKAIRHFAIGDQVNEDAWIGFVLYNAQSADAEFRVWAEVEQDHRVLNLEQGYSSSPPRGLR